MSTVIKGGTIVAAMARSYSRGTVAESCNAIPVESKMVIFPNGDCFAEFASD